MKESDVDLKESVKVLFASASEDLIPGVIEEMRRLFPELPLLVVSEFPPKDADWIPFPVSRGFHENLAFFRWRFRTKHVRISAVILQPRVPYWQMRWIAFFVSPWNFLAFNENFGHFMLRPVSAGVILWHVLWRVRNFVVSQFLKGGVAYALAGWVRHPGRMRRPVSGLLAKGAGVVTVLLKRILPSRSLATESDESRPAGISVVIPSRNGAALLRAMLPETVRQITAVSGEVIVVDNGSSDGTTDFLTREFPSVIVEHSETALSFARAVNAGIRKSRYAHVCLLNNDMRLEPGFFEALRVPFHQVPDLFSATAQIFFPEGMRREETGKAVMPALSDRKPADFPVRCDLPSSGEDLSYVLYGSGGCTLFDARKLHQLGGMNEIYEPAYVEDLDLGFRAWQQGWPSVFVAGARVLHQHRATTSRYYSPGFLERTLEANYLRFLAHSISDPRVFHRLWREAVQRLDFLSGEQKTDSAALRALSQAWAAPLWTGRLPRLVLGEEQIFAIGSGAVTVVPGRARRDLAVVLIATPYLPFPLAHGGAVRMYNLMRRAATDYNLVLVSFSGESRETPPELLDLCCEVVLVKRTGTHRIRSKARPDIVEEFDSPAFHAAVRQTVRKWNPSIAQLEFTQMAQYALDCAPAATVLVEHDITFDLYQQFLAKSDDWELRRQLERWIPFETAAWSQVDRVITMSEKDRAMIAVRGSNATKAVTLPNGVDLVRFRTSSRAPDPRRLLFIGSFAHLPNVLAVDFFLREVWPRLAGEGTIWHVIAGARHQYYLDRYRDRVRLNLLEDGIEVEDFVADVRPAYERAAVVVAPLVASAGTNIKIMEAMAMGKAIVSTPAGINGLDLHPGRDVLVTQNGAEMANAILGLFENPERRCAFERQARETAERDFDWDAIAERQKQIYAELTELAREHGIV